MNQYKNEKTGKWYAIFRYRIKKYILPYFGDNAIKDITAGMIRTWQNEKLIPNFQKNTSVELCRILNSILSYGVKYYGLSVNPAKIAGFVRYPNAVKEAVIKYWTQEPILADMDAEDAHA